MKALVVLGLLVWFVPGVAFATPAQDCNSDDPPRMILGCTQLLPHFKNNPKELGIIYTRRGFARSHQGDLGGAEADYTRAIEVAPRYVAAWKNRMAIREKQHRYAEAIDDATHALSLAPDAAVYGSRALSRSNLPGIVLPDRIVDDARRAIELGNKTTTPYFALVNLNIKQRDYRGAVEQMTKVIAIRPVASSYATRAQFYFRLGDHEAGQHDLNEAAQLDPDSPDVSALQATVALVGGKYDEARRLFDKSLSKDPSGATYVNRGITEELLNMPREALADYASAAAQGWDTATLHYHWGLALAVTGDMAGAEEHLTHALLLDENMRGIQYVRGLVRWALNKKDEADLDFKEAAERDPEYSGRRQTLHDMTRKRISFIDKPLPPKAHPKVE